MSMLVAALMFVVMLAVSIACLMWAIGSRWPIRNPELLANTVIGRPGVLRVPRLPSLLLGIAILAAGVFALALADRTAGGWWLSIIGALLGALFLARGAAGYSAGWRARHAVEPFATLDRKNYSPVALAIGAGYLLLVIMRLI